MSFITKFFGLNKRVNKEVKEDFDLDSFKSINDFWTFITQDQKWYLKYSPYEIKNIDIHLFELEPLIIQTTNEIRKKMEFTYDEYWKIIDWDNVLIKAEIDELNNFKRNKSIQFKQFCSNCKQERSFSQRYPKCICPACYSKTTNLTGRKVEFFNTEALGNGCQGYFVGTDQKEKYDSDLCYIDGKEFFAEEARFGGIVIQLKE